MAHAKQILVVDDEEAVRTAIRSLLEKSGHTVEAVASGAAAVAAAQARRPDLVVLDLGMPGMDGWAVIEKLQSDAPPFVLLASHADNPQDGPFKDCIAAYLYKPVEPNELAAACRRILASRPETPSQAAERRQSKRRRIICKVVLLSRNGNPAVNGRLIDLSSTGIQMEIDAPLEMGDRIRVALHVPGPTPQVELEGLVLWRNPVEQGFTYGIDLGRVTAGAAKVLSAAFAPLE
jgi:CheY-like chemotaxis protein